VNGLLRLKHLISSPVGGERLLGETMIPVGYYGAMLPRWGVSNRRVANGASAQGEGER